MKLTDLWKIIKWSFLQEPRIEERWHNPDQCSLCGKIPELRDCWTQEHVYPPDFTFVWCPDCEKDRKACDTKIGESTEAWWRRRNELR